MDRAKLDQSLDKLTKAVSTLPGLNASMVLYGSAARGDWIPGRSDVNLLLLVDDVSHSALRQLTPAVTAWHANGFVPPLIMGRAEWVQSTDVFPIEITDMQLSHKLLCGADPVKGMAVAPADLREAVEKELRGKLIRLRQAYVRFGDAGMILGGFALASISTYFALLRCIAVLYRRPPGTTTADTATALSAELGADVQVATEIARHRGEPEWNCPPDSFTRYLDLVCRTVELVDTFHLGDQ
ncbi:MAG TPA: nucleotidyltransferase domain-containing protein [Gemmatimonadales bacterium]|jgi:hypothetical protein